MCRSPEGTVVGASKPSSVATVPCAELPAWLNADSQRTRGEFALVVEGAEERVDRTLSEADERLLQRLLQELPASRAARVAADISGKPRDAYYRHALTLGDRGDEQ